MIVWVLGVHPEIRCILARIESEDPEVLRHSLAFAEQRLRDEAQRGRSSDARATAVLAFLGVLAGIIVLSAPRIVSATQTAGSLLILGLSIPFLLRGVYCAFRALGSQLQNRLVPEAACKLQEQCLTDALRLNIAMSIWACKQMVKPNTTKLFWLARAQRWSLISIFAHALLGSLSYAFQDVLESWPSCPALVVMGLALVAVCTLDSAFESEKWSIWKKE